uniref:Uncharacterized protein n=1 Tax=Anguilla anguilla TaxID=7936 RepID=A0A0E9XCS8_ANGAN
MGNCFAKKYLYLLSYTGYVISFMFAMFFQVFTGTVHFVSWGTWLALAII